MDASTWLAEAGAVAAACEQFRPGPLGQPANTVTSAAFVLVGVAIVVARRGAAGLRWPFGLLVVAVGLGSLAQHGPHPPWQAYAHDLPLLGLLSFVAADAAADLAGRRSPGWWPVAAGGLLPLALVPVVAHGSAASTLAQALLAVAAIGLSLARAARRPRLRRRLLIALAVLAGGAAVGGLTDRTGWCQPDTLLQGHAVWHVLAAGAMWWLAPVIGARGAATGYPPPAAPTAPAACQRVE